MNKFIDAHIKGINFFRVAEKPDGVYETTDIPTTFIIVALWILGNFAISIIVVSHFSCEDETSPSLLFVAIVMIFVPYVIQTIFKVLLEILTDVIIPALDKGIKK